MVKIRLTNNNGVVLDADINNNIIEFHHNNNKFIYKPNNLNKLDDNIREQLICENKYDVNKIIWLTTYNMIGGCYIIFPNNTYYFYRDGYGMRFVFEHIGTIKLL